MEIPCPYCKGIVEEAAWAKGTPVHVCTTCNRVWAADDYLKLWEKEIGKGGPSRSHNGPFKRD
jgi:hypothetical protein